MTEQTIITRNGFDIDVHFCNATDSARYIIEDGLEVSRSWNHWHEHWEVTTSISSLRSFDSGDVAVYGQMIATLAEIHDELESGNMPR